MSSRSHKYSPGNSAPNSTDGGGSVNRKPLTQNRLSSRPGETTASANTNVAKSPASRSKKEPAATTAASSVATTSNVQTIAPSVASTTPTTATPQTAAAPTPPLAPPSPVQQTTIITLDSPSQMSAPRVLTPTPQSPPTVDIGAGTGSGEKESPKTPSGSPSSSTPVQHLNPAHKPSSSADAANSVAKIHQTVVSSPSPRKGSPAPSPRPSPTHSPQSRGVILSAQRTSAMGTQAILDWRPYSGTNVETILSPELEARKEEVAKRKEEALRAERAKFITHTPNLDHSNTAGGNKTTTGAANQTPPLQPHKALAPAGSAHTTPTGGPTAPPHSHSTAAAAAHAVSAVHTMRRLPNAKTSAQHDVGAEIFGQSNKSLAPPSGTGTRKRGTMESGRVHIGGEKDAGHKRTGSTADGRKATGGVIREIRVRTCGFSGVPGTPPPPGSGWLYGIIEHSRIYLYFSICATIFSLFAHDFSVAFLPKLLDDSVSGLLLCAMVLFSLEILANIYSKQNYLFWSFLFWLDLVGTFSLCFDISWINDSFFPTSSSSDISDGSANSGDSNGQVARSASILRLTKFARILRILKLVRIVRVFKLQKTLKKSSHLSSSATPSKVGLTLSELSDKKVIGIIMTVLVLFPFFLVTPPEDISGSLGLEMLGGMLRSGNSTLIQEGISTYLSRQLDHSHLFELQLTIAGTWTTLLQNNDYLSSLRPNEFESFILEDPPGFARFSHRNDIWLDAIYTLCFTLAVIIIFTVGSFLLNRDVQTLVVDPLDRMTLMVKKLAGTILFLNHPNDPEGGSGIGGGTTGSGGFNPDGSPAFGPSYGGPNGARAASSGEIAGFETEAIEEVISQMANIFSVEKDDTPGMPKSLAILSGSKHTQIRTLNSVVQIDVSERPRELGEDEDLDDTTGGMSPGFLGHGLGTLVEKNTGGGGNGNGNGDTSQSHHHAISMTPVLSIMDYPECSTIESILHNSSVLPYFKLFMTSNLTLENLLFVQEVDRFRTIMKLHVLNLYNAFVSPKAPNQVNLPSMQRDRILSELDNPSVTMFDESQQECITLMGGFLKQFQSSKYCKGYMKRHQMRGQHGHTLAAPVLVHNPPSNTASRIHISRHAPAPSTPATGRTPHFGSTTPFLTPQLQPMKLGGDDLVPLTPNVDTQSGVTPVNTKRNVSGGKLALGPGIGTANSALVRSRSPSQDRSAQPPVPSAEVYLPGSVPTSPTDEKRDLSRQQQRESFERRKSNGRGVLEEAGAALIRTASMLGESKRSSGRAAPAVAVGEGITIAETDLNAQIAALIESEGPAKLRQEREAISKRASYEQAARRASFNKSMDATTTAVLQQMALEAANAEIAAGATSPSAAASSSKNSGHSKDGSKATSPHASGKFNFSPSS